MDKDIFLSTVTQKSDIRNVTHVDVKRKICVAFTETSIYLTQNYSTIVIIYFVCKDILKMCDDIFVISK